MDSDMELLKCEPVVIVKFEPPFPELKCEPEEIVKSEPLFTENSYDVTVNNDILVKTECESVSFSLSDCGTLNYDIIEEEAPLAASEHIQGNSGNLMNAKSSASCRQTRKLQTRTKKQHHCPYCNRNFTRRDSFSNHLWRKHSKKNPDFLVEKFDKMHFTCDICKFTSTCSRSLKSHMFVHEQVVDSKIFKCKNCDYKCSDKTRSRVHIQRKHSNDRSTYSCTSCNNRFFTKLGLADHLLGKHGDKFDNSLKTILEQNIKHCNLCDFKTIRKWKLTQHTTKHDRSLVKADTDTIIFKCYNCDYETFRKCTLRNHIQCNHSNNGPTYLCRFCNKTFFSKVGLAGHLLGKHGDKFDNSLKTLHDQNVKHCKLCGFKTIRKWKLTQHMTNHGHSLVKADTNTIIFKCYNCDYETFRKSTLRNHIQCNHSNDRPTYSCRFCNKTFFNKASLVNHLLFRHGDRFDKSLKTLLEQNIIHCYLCDFRTITQRNLIQHMRKHGADTTILKCNYCDHKTRDKSNLKVHIQRKHSHDRPTYSCTFCDEMLSTKAYLADHLLVYHGDRFDKSLKTLLEQNIKHCNLCDFRAIQQRRLIQHMRKHGADTIMFKCNYCDHKTRDKSNLRVHIQRKHSHDRPTYTCRFCKKTLLENESLADHLLFYHGDNFDKSLKTLLSLTIKHCKLCDFRTIFKSKLNQHMTKHGAGTIIIKCNYCDHKTFDKSNLRVHIQRVHSNDRPKYSCRFCEKSFFDKGCLVDHLLCLHGDKFDRSLKTVLSRTIKHCKLCDFRTVKNLNINRHMAKHDHLNRRTQI